MARHTRGRRAGRGGERDGGKLPDKTYTFLESPPPRVGRHEAYRPPSRPSSRCPPPDAANRLGRCAWGALPPR